MMHGGKAHNRSGAINHLLTCCFLQIALACKVAVNQPYSLHISIKRSAQLWLLQTAEESAIRRF